MKKQEYYTKVINLFQNDNLTRQDIAKALKISMPTTLQIVNELLENGILVEVGSLESTGGRKAKCLALNAKTAYILGINVGLHHVSMAILNYLGEEVYDYRYETIYQDKAGWYEQLRQHIDIFLVKRKIKMEKILCAGISFPGIIDDAGGWIVHSHVFGLHNVSLDRFYKILPIPVVVFNDANSGGYTELQSYGQSYVYLSLNESVGGAIIVNGKLYVGNTFHTGEIGHIILVPGGKNCYCGKAGCVDAYLRAGLLMDEQRDIHLFAKKLDNKDPQAMKLWQEYLDWLAILATNLRMIFNTNLIIGGEIGKIVDPYLPELKEKMAATDLFARDIDYIFGCKTKKNAMAIGAGRLALAKYKDCVLKQV